MQDQSKPAEGNSPEEAPKGEGVSDAMKGATEAPQYTEKAPEAVGGSEQKQELHEVIEKNKEEIKRQEKFSEVAKTATQKPAAKDEGYDDEEKKQQARQHAKEIAGIDDAEIQVDKVIELATSKDPYFAIKVAQHLDDNYLLDQVHDELVEDKVRNVLIEKGLLKEE